MSKPFAVFDVDGTQLKSACLEMVTDTALELGIFNKEHLENAASARRLWQPSNNEGVYQRYLSHMVGGFVAAIAGVKVKDLDRAIELAVDRNQGRIHAYPRQLAQLLKHSHTLISISGSPEIFVEPFLADFGFEEIYGSQFEIEDGSYTGNAKSVNKAEIVKHLQERGDISVGIGDTIGDDPVLQASMCAIAFNPSGTLRKKAQAEGWYLVRENKDDVWQLLPQENGNYLPVFESSPAIILEAAGVMI